MSMLSFFLGQKKKSAAVAKERLRLIIAHERTDPARSDYLPALQRELLAVISKYVNVTNEEIKVHLERQEKIDESLFEALEDALLMADAGVAASGFLIQALRQKARAEHMGDGEAARAAL